MRDLSGTTLGNYEVVERLAAGGMAVVYRAVQHPLGREVALKVLTPALVDEVGFIQRFEIEAKTLARLDHPNILPIYDFGAADDVVFLATPLAHRGTLRQLMDSGPLEPVRAWRYLREVGDALQHAHEAGVIHRDLKPQNVLVHADGRAMLADFGLARSAATPADLTGYGFAIGTPGYMAPEQVLAKGIDHRADIYALGVLTFEMLTGKMPYADGTPMEIAYATLNEPIPSACDLNRILPFELDMLLQRVLAKDPEQRPATMRQLVAELGRLPQRRSPGARRPGSDPTAPAASTAPATAARARATSRITLKAPSTATPGSAVQTLDQLGIKRTHGTQRYSLNSHFANAVRVARVVATGRWPEVAEAAGLSQLLAADPPDDDQHTTPVENLSLLNEAFELVFGPQAPDLLRTWGRLATDRSLGKESAGRHRALKLLPGPRRLAIVLKAFTESMDRVRGEHTHTWKQMDDSQFWLVHYTNLYALGRLKKEKACYVWTASFESMLRWAGLANNWYVEEIECGCVTGTFDCVFGIRSVRS